MVILGTAHGINVSGKHMVLPEDMISEEIKKSPVVEIVNGKYTFSEWKSSRLICKRIKEILDADDTYNHQTEIDWLDDNEPSLQMHIDRVNEILREYAPGTKVYYMSMHHNALGMGDKFYSGRGISGWTLPQNDNSDLYLSTIMDTVAELIPECKVTGLNINGGMYSAGFKVLHERVPAILMETLFYTNRDDLNQLLDDDIREKICQCYAEAIKRVHKEYID